eukprot:COSAG02_NODE_67_length_42609_cov_14.506681_40_plen_75_part_00
MTNPIPAEWSEGFTADMRADAANSGYVDRRSSNGGGYKKQEIGSVCKDWERMAGWIKNVEALQRMGNTTHVRQR